MRIGIRLGPVWISTGGGRRYRRPRTPEEQLIFGVLIGVLIVVGGIAAIVNTVTKHPVSAATTECRNINSAYTGWLDTTTNATDKVVLAETQGFAAAVDRYSDPQAQQLAGALTKLENSLENAVAEPSMQPAALADATSMRNLADRYTTCS
jgi:hypothetical protein